MDQHTTKREETLPPPPPPLAGGDMKRPLRVPMARTGFGQKGQRIQLLTNHIQTKLQLPKTDGYFFQYSVFITYEDGTAVDAKGIGRKVIDRVSETYHSQLSDKHIAYDGEKTLFTVGPLPGGNILDFTVLLDDLSSSNRISTGNGSPNGGNDQNKRFKRQQHTKTYNVSIHYATKIPIQAITNALHGGGIQSEHFSEAVRVLDIILRQHAAKQGCLLVRQSFFHNQPCNFSQLGGGVVGCRGFHSSFRATQSGLSLNIDTCTTMIVKPGPVIDFLLLNQNVKDPNSIDWSKAKRMLKNLRIRITTSNAEYKITGLSEKICNEQTFSLKTKNQDLPIELTVYDYFISHRKIPLRSSRDLPCINVGKPKRPTFIPMEHCELVSLQRYTKALTNLQRASLVEKSRQKPQERLKTLNEALRISNYNADPLLEACGVTINDHFTSVDGRVLSPPKLRVGKGEDFIPGNGRWNFNNKKLVEPAKIGRWAVVNFSARLDIDKLIVDLIRCAEMKGISILPPFGVLEEKPQFRRISPIDRVEKMFEEIKDKLPKVPEFLLCVLPDKKNSDLYGPWKRKNLTHFGIVTQCIAPTKINDQYITNVILKINAKMGGLNSLLAIEADRRLPVVSRVPTLIVGMDVSHGAAGRDVPSTAAIVSSTEWPNISRYRAVVRNQSPKTEMFESLYQRVGDKDLGIFRKVLYDFYTTSHSRKPEHIIIFRDGVSESQFNQVLNIEFDQILQACKHLDEKWSPKFTLVVAQKNHHTKFFQTNSPDNVPPGTVVDTGICHPRNNDFYMCAHAGMIGTSRPTHYQVLHDEIGFSADELQELVNSLSYVYQRSTTAVSIVAPISYAHHAASQMSQFIKFDEFSETSSHDPVTVTDRAIPQLPMLEEKVMNSMFFC